MTYSLLYVSVQTFAVADTAATIARIVDTSRARNGMLGVTGALIATTRHFAHLIEGPSEPTAALFGTIRHDPRHRDVTVVLAETLPGRRFGNWSLAYHGQSSYLDHIVAPLVVPHAATTLDGQRLIGVMRSLAAESKVCAG